MKNAICKLEISTYVTHHMTCYAMEVWMQAMFSRCLLMSFAWLEGLEERREEAEGVGGSGEEEGRYMESRFCYSLRPKVAR